MQRTSQMGEGSAWAATRTHHGGLTRSADAWPSVVRSASPPRVSANRLASVVRAAVTARSLASPPSAVVRAAATTPASSGARADLFRFSPQSLTVRRVDSGARADGDARGARSPPAVKTPSSGLSPRRSAYNEDWLDAAVFPPASAQLEPAPTVARCAVNAAAPARAWS